MTKFRLVKVVDKYYSDMSYVVLKLSQIEGEHNFKEGEVISITNKTRKRGD